MTSCLVDRASTEFHLGACAAARQWVETVWGMPRDSTMIIKAAKRQLRSNQKIPGLKA